NGCQNFLAMIGVIALGSLFFSCSFCDRVKGRSWPLFAILRSREFASACSSQVRIKVGDLCTAFTADNIIIERLVIHGFAFFAFAPLAVLALRAASLRSSTVRFLAVALPPFRPSSTA